MRVGADWARGGEPAGRGERETRERGARRQLVTSAEVKRAQANKQKSSA